MLASPRKTACIYSLFTEHWRESPDSRESFQDSRTELLFCESRFRWLKIANRRFEAIRANRPHIMKIEVFLRIDSRESICFGAIRVANRRAIWSEPILGKGMRRSTFQWKKGLSVKRGEAIQWKRGLARMSTGNAIQWRGSGHSLNRRTLKTEKLLSSSQSLRIYPYPMVWPLPRPWSETMVSIPPWAQKTLEIKGFLPEISGSGAPIFGFGRADPAPKG